MEAICDKCGSEDIGFSISDNRPEPPKRKMSEWSGFSTVTNLVYYPTTTTLKCRGCGYEVSHTK